jgi:hypothetical protein
MFTSITRKPGWAAVALIALLGLFLGTVRDARAAEPKKMSKKQVTELIATAKSPAEHMQLAGYYKAEADKLDAEAQEHEEFAVAYRKNTASQAAGMKNPMAPNTAAHCDEFAKTVHEAAKSARELGASHEQMAKDATANGK